MRKKTETSILNTTEHQMVIFCDSEVQKSHGKRKMRIRFLKDDGNPVVTDKDGWIACKVKMVKNYVAPFKMT